MHHSTRSTPTEAHSQCPPWCDPARHISWCDDEVHSALAAPSPWGEITVVQTAVDDGRPVDDEIRIYLPADPNHGDLSATDAIELATALWRAARQLEAIITPSATGSPA